MDARRVSHDFHTGWVGKTNQNNLFRVRVTRGRGPFVLRCYYWTPKDCEGQLLLSKLPHGSTKAIAKWSDKSTPNQIWPTEKQAGNAGLNEALNSWVQGAAPHPIDYDVTQHLEGNGKYQIEFRYISGRNGTFIKGVELLRLGRRTFVEWAQENPFLTVLYILGAVASVCAAVYGLRAPTDQISPIQPSSLGSSRLEPAKVETKALANSREEPMIEDPADPGLATALERSAVLLMNSDPAGAAQKYKRASAIYHKLALTNAAYRVNEADATYNFGKVLQKQGLTNEAQAAFESAIAIRGSKAH